MWNTLSFGGGRRRASSQALALRSVMLGCASGLSNKDVAVREQVDDVADATLEAASANATHWSRSKMAERSSLSRSAIGWIWRDFELKPHRAETFKLPTDPLFVGEAFDVIGLYVNPPQAATVLCVDEKIQAAGLARGQGDQ